jgi:uncharacterized membrane protein
LVSSVARTQTAASRLDPNPINLPKEPRMNTTKTLAGGSLAALIAMSLSIAASTAVAAKDDTEKCAGVVKAGKNDCGTSKSACAGTSKVDRDPEAWVIVPKGTCERIAGGTLTNKPENQHGGAAALKKG